MLRYLVILLDDTSVSYCHYDNPNTTRKMIPVDILRKAFLYAMKNNLSIQLVYPDYEIPQQYEAIIESSLHIRIVPSGYPSKANIVVFREYKAMIDYIFERGISYVLRTSKRELFNNIRLLQSTLAKVDRLNVIITDIESFDEEGFSKYKLFLHEMSSCLEKEYRKGKWPQFNLLSDRIVLNQMNNCNAGWDTVTLAPDGNFYICPAFYVDKAFTIGSLDTEIDIKNAQLYKLDYAPLCRKCDAYQCKRCVFLNRKLTLEVNTPSHEQCVTAHLERNASRILLNKVKKINDCWKDKVIENITYLDPFDVRNNN